MNGYIALRAKTQFYGFQWYQIKSQRFVVINLYFAHFFPHHIIFLCFNRKLEKFSGSLHSFQVLFNLCLFTKFLYFYWNNIAFHIFSICMKFVLKVIIFIFFEILGTSLCKQLIFHMFFLVFELFYFFYSNE